MGITAGILSVGATGYGLYQQNKATNSGERLTQNALATAPNPAATQIAADAAARTAGAAQRKRSAGAQGYKSTLLTGPQGVTTPAPAQKTLLGS